MVSKKCKVINCNDFADDEGYCDKHLKDVIRARYHNSYLDAKEKAASKGIEFDEYKWKKNNPKPAILGGEQTWF